MDAVKKLSPAVFGLIIFCFVLPFVNLTCSGQTIMSLTGFQLITGTDLDQNMFNQQGMFEQQEMQTQSESKENVEAQPMALFAFLAALFAFAISFVKKKVTALICMIISILGCVFLLMLKINMDSDASTAGAEMVIQLEYQFAYWFSLLLFAAGAVLQWILFKEPDYGNITHEIPPAIP
jgi:hypothetical protein